MGAKTGAGSRQKGSRWERDVVAYLHGRCWPAAHRTRTPGFEADRGDVGGLPLVIECKNVERWSVQEWMRQAEEAGMRAGLPWCVVAKRPGLPVDEAAVIVPADLFFTLLEAAS